ncbi:Ldh family oxidoreductase [SAR202 cluster bacterium AC-409-J13_OGT_754m]|nr:Ldh family oxidoreductase [SAR202 cluster bacterium AC-409-J13_OGT_754m]
MGESFVIENLGEVDENKILVGESELRTLVEQIFTKLGVPIVDAHTAADVLVTTDLRGVESHGVSGQFSSYVEDYIDGITNPDPVIKTVRETAASANLDCDKGLGIIVAPKAMEIAISKAENQGVGMVTMHNTRHMGMASYYAMMALEKDMIGLAMTSAGPSVLPTYGAIPRLGTNPIALAAPTNQEKPFVYDAATSVIASNKIDIWKRAGKKIGPGLVADIYGSPIMESIDPSDYIGPSLLPLGTTREMGSHKGYGLACMVSILTGILSGGGFDSFPGRPNYYHMVAAYKIDAFTDLDIFKSTLDEFMLSLKNTPPMPGQDRVLVPGQIEWETYEYRKNNGIPIHRDVISWLEDTCKKLNIPMKLK